jgi:hypothetical protein
MGSGVFGGGGGDAHPVILVTGDTWNKRKKMANSKISALEVSHFRQVVDWTDCRNRGVTFA